MNARTRTCESVGVRVLYTYVTKNVGMNVDVYEYVRVCVWD